MYRIAAAHPRRLQSTIVGFLSVAELLEYADRMAAAHQRYCRFASAYQLVIDVSAAKILSQDVLAAIGQHIAAFPPAERVGVVVGKSLNRYQALRLMDRPHVRFADKLDEAQCWAFGAPFAENDMTILQTAEPHRIKPWIPQLAPSIAIVRPRRRPRL